MNTKRNYLFSFIFIAVALMSRTSFAATTQKDQKCAELIKECFAYGDDERSHCFYTAANHSFCSESPLAKIAMRRWELLPSGYSVEEGAHALTGPKLVDRQCIANFDSTWSAKLIKGELKTEQLAQKLDECQKPSVMELMHP